MQTNGKRRRIGVCAEQLNVSAVCSLAVPRRFMAEREGAAGGKKCVGKTRIYFCFCSRQFLYISPNRRRRHRCRRSLLSGGPGRAGAFYYSNIFCNKRNKRIVSPDAGLRRDRADGKRIQLNKEGMANKELPISHADKKGRLLRMRICQIS